MGDVPKNMELSCDINGIFIKHCQKYRCLPKKGNSRKAGRWLSTGAFAAFQVPQKVLEDPVDAVALAVGAPW